MKVTTMQVTEVANDGLKRAYTVLVPAADIAAERARRLDELGRELRLPGFRPGKIPATVVKQRYGQAVMSEVLEQSVSKATQQVVTDRGLRPALQPKIELVNFADGADLEFKVEVELLPEIPMPDFSGIELERLKAEPAEEQVAKTLETIAARNRKLEDITEDRGAAKGEVAVCDFVGTLEGEAEPFPGGTASDMPIEVAGTGFIPGFTEQLEGIKSGEKRTVNVSFPEEYGAKELAGKARGLQRHLQGAEDPGHRRRSTTSSPSSMGLEDLAKLQRQAVADHLQQEYDGLARMKVKRALLDALAEQASFQVPQGMVEAEFDQIWQRIEADLKAGRLDADDQGKDEETLKADYRAIAERRVRLGLLLAAVGRTTTSRSRQEI